MIELYLDSASIEEIARYSADDRITGFTTNPSLMRKAGVTDYLAYVPQALAAARGKPVSFEVVEGSEDSVYRQARILAAYGPAVYVKVPVVKEDGTSFLRVIGELSEEGVQVNVTAVCTDTQVRDVVRVLIKATAPSILSIFAGRIADTGVDPEPFFHAASAHRLYGTKRVKLLWASTREGFNIQQAKRCGADIITVSPELLAKHRAWNLRPLEQVSRETVQQFNADAHASGLSL